MNPAPGNLVLFVLNLHNAILLYLGRLFQVFQSTHDMIIMVCLGVNMNRKMI